MVKGMLTARRLAIVFAFAVALLGWAAAYLTVRGTKDLEDGLASAEAELSETRAALAQKADELAALRLEYREYQDMSGRLEKVGETLTGNIARLKDLSLQIDEAEARLDQLRADAREQQSLLTGTTRDYVTTTRARVRARPSAASEELAVVPSGTPLAVLEIVEEGTWYKVGSVGFMYHELLKPITVPMSDAPAEELESPTKPDANVSDFACLQGGMVRAIRVEYSGSVGEPPCSVVYEKSAPEQPSTEILWRTQHEKGFCEARARELVEKLRSSNWKCGLFRDVLGMPE